MEIDAEFPFRSRCSEQNSGSLLKIKVKYLLVWIKVVHSGILVVGRGRIVVNIDNLVVGWGRVFGIDNLVVGRGMVFGVVVVVVVVAEGFPLEE